MTCLFLLTVVYRLAAIIHDKLFKNLHPPFPLREAADLLHLNLIETIDLLIELGVKGNIKAKDVMEDLKALPS